MKLHGKKLEKGTDYTLSYKNNTNVGIATMTVKGIGAYKDTISKTFEIVPAKVAVPVGKPGLVYTGRAQIGVASGEAYTLSGTRSATNAGTYTAKAALKDKANYVWEDGTVSVKAITWSIAAKPVTPTVALSATSFAYDGKRHIPKVTVKVGSKVLPADSYKVTYSPGCKAVGTYKATVKLKGNYSGKRSVSFKIVPKATSIKSIQPASCAFTVTWKKVTEQADGYQLMYATDPKFSKGKGSLTVASASTTSTKVVGLREKTRYFVKVRTYKTVGGKTYCSAWSAAEDVSTQSCTESSSQLLGFRLNRL